MRPDLVGTCLSGTTCHIECHWIAAVSFLGLGLLVGWLHGYFTAKGLRSESDFSKKSSSEGAEDE